MNIENMQKVIAHLKTLKGANKPKVGFNMGDYFFETEDEGIEDHSGHGCGTVACIAGHTCLLLGKKENFHESAQEILGLTWLQSNSLFFAEGASLQLEEIHLNDAIWVLEEMVNCEKQDKTFDIENLWHQATLEG